VVGGELRLARDRAARPELADGDLAAELVGHVEVTHVDKLQTSLIQVEHACR
jgi:hypothetical protein